MPDLTPGQWAFVLIALPIALSGAVAWLEGLCYDRSRPDPPRRDLDDPTDIKDQRRH